MECNVAELPAETLPGAGPLRIAFISDVHNNRGMLDEAIGMIEAAKPDLIIFGGDFIAVDERIMRTRKHMDLLRRLKEIAPTYAILGNMDYERLEQVTRIFATAGCPCCATRRWTGPHRAARPSASSAWESGTRATRPPMPA